ncbi:MAG TPA: S8 family serine peptidase [Ignavibacteria bacterium]|nr:S8 family serine peptidase [Ignavibacteria bacterium]
MKTIYTFLIFLFTANFIYSQDFYFYKGSKIELKQRNDVIALILNSKNYSGEFVSENLKNLIDSRDILKKIDSDIYLVKYNSARSQDEINEQLNIIRNNSTIVKISVNAYYGSSKKVTQIPTDRFTVKLKNGKDIDRLNSLNVMNNCTIEGKFSNEKGYLIKTNSNVSKNALELSEIYYSSGLFEYSEPDFLYPEKCLFLSVPNDPYFQTQWSLKNSGQLIQTGSPFAFYGDASAVNGIPGADMGVSDAWDFTTGSPNIKIGILDTGIDSLHPDLQQAGHLLCGYDAVNNINSSAVDIGYHGTSVAGLIGAVMNNSTGIAGVAPDCKLMSVLITDNYGNSYSSDITRAFDSSVAIGLDVLCNSWGGGTPLSSVTDAINNAAGNGGLGCIILFASGNDGNNPPLYPSVLPDVLSIGSSTQHDQAKSPGTGNYFFWGSNYGENSIGELDMIAPTSCYTLVSGGGYDPNFWGTSASCPNAAGVAALVLSVNPSQTREEVYNNLTRGCDKTDNIPYDKDKTYGKWSEYNGYGRVNALNSVRLAAGIDITPPLINHLNVSSISSTYPTDITAEITDQDGTPVPVTGNNQPKLFYKIKKASANWTFFDSLCAYSVTGNIFTFKIPSQGWETEVRYYIKASDNNNNINTFPKHSPNPFYLCYFAVGNITSEVKKIPAFAGADYGATVSPSVNFGNFKILDAKIILNMRHTYLDDEVIQIFTPFTDANNNRKCLFASNGGSGDNIYGSVISDSATNNWSNATPPYLNGSFKPEFNLKGLNGNSASGNWKILHFDRSNTDYAFFDSVKIILSRTTGITSSAIQVDNSLDSMINFNSDNRGEDIEKDFYLKNSGTANLNISGTFFTGEFSELFSIVNTPPASIPPGDSGLFRINLNLQSGGNLNDSDSGDTPLMNIQTNDPSKPLFKVTLHSNSPVLSGLKNLTLTAFSEGLYDINTNTISSDSLKVFLRNTFFPYAIIDSSVSLISDSGSGLFSFGNVSNDTNFYLVLDYRNGIQTWSSTGNHFTDSELNYNFTDSLSKAFGGNLSLKGNIYCIWSGDVNKDNVIDGTDISLVENAASLSQKGYVSEDLNNDGFVDASDLHLVENNSTLMISVISP